MMLCCPVLPVLQTVGRYHLGEFVNRFQHGSLVMRLPDSGGWVAVAGLFVGGFGLGRIPGTACCNLLRAAPDSCSRLLRPAEPCCYHVPYISQS